MFYFLQFVYLSSTTKEKFLFHALFFSLNPWKYYIPDNTSTYGCVPIVWCIDPFVVVVVMWYLDPREKTPHFNNTLLRNTQNSYNKTTLVRNRHKERDWDKSNRQRSTGTGWVRKAIPVHIHQGMLGACVASIVRMKAQRSVWRSVPTFRQDPEGSSYHWQFQVQYWSIMELVP